MLGRYTGCIQAPGHMARCDQFVRVMGDIATRWHGGNRCSSSIRRSDAIWQVCAGIWTVTTDTGFVYPDLCRFTGLPGDMPGQCLPAQKAR